MSLSWVQAGTHVFYGRSSANERVPAFVALLHAVQHKCNLCCPFSSCDCGMHLNIFMFYSNDYVVYSPDFLLVMFHKVLQVLLSGTFL